MAIVIARFIDMSHTNILWKAEKDIYVFGVQVSGVLILNLGQKFGIVNFSLIHSSQNFSSIHQLQ
jgi:DNA-binding MurR/RpiR family transcriptional regulator